MSVTIGADPEWFVYQGIANTWSRYGGIIPSCGLIGGTKEAPIDMGDGYAIHEDNVAVELTIPASTCAGEFADHMIEGKTRMARDYLAPIETSLMQQSSHKFSAAMLEAKGAKEFGCEPDFDAYSNGKIRHTPRKLMEDRHRFAGGHIHIGGDFNCPPFVAALFADIFIGLPSLWPVDGVGWPMVSKGQSERLEWYGQPGIFRPKPYGIEYRSPCNTWTANRNSCSNVGDKALRLGFWLEATSATKIREALKGIDWIALRKLLSTQNGNRDMVRDQVAEMIDSVQAWCPV